MHLSTKDELKLRQQKKANQYLCRAVETPLKNHGIDAPTIR